jgi:hypothetical protein
MPECCGVSDTCAARRGKYRTVGLGVFAFPNPMGVPYRGVLGAYANPLAVLALEMPDDP